MVAPMVVAFSGPKSSLSMMGAVGRLVAITRTGFLDLGGEMGGGSVCHSGRG
jgi:hypothetical protein